MWERAKEMGCKEFTMLLKLLSVHHQGGLRNKDSLDFSFTFEWVWVSFNGSAVLQAAHEG